MLESNKCYWIKEVGQNKGGSHLLNRVVSIGLIWTEPQRN